MGGGAGRGDQRFTWPVGRVVTSWCAITAGDPVATGTSSLLEWSEVYSSRDIGCWWYTATMAHYQMTVWRPALSEQSKRFAAWWPRSGSTPSVSSASLSVGSSSGTWQP